MRPVKCGSGPAHSRSARQPIRPLWRRMAPPVSAGQPCRRGRYRRCVRALQSRVGVCSPGAGPAQEQLVPAPATPGPVRYPSRPRTSAGHDGRHPTRRPAAPSDTGSPSTARATARAEDAGRPDPPAPQRVRRADPPRDRPGSGPPPRSTAARPTAGSRPARTAAPRTRSAAVPATAAAPGRTGPLPRPVRPGTPRCPPGPAVRTAADPRCPGPTPAHTPGGAASTAHRSTVRAGPPATPSAAGTRSHEYCRSPCPAAPVPTTRPPGHPSTPLG